MPIFPQPGFPSPIQETLDCFARPDFKCPTNPVPFLAVLGDSQGGSSNPLRVSLYDLANDWAAVPDTPPVAEQPDQATQVFGLNYNASGTRLAAAHQRDGGVTVWNTIDWTQIPIPDLYYYGEPPNDTVPRYGAFRPDGTQFLVSFTGAQAGPVPFWTWYQLYNIVGDTWTLGDNMDLLFGTDPTHPTPAAVSYHFAYSPDGLYIAVPFQGGTSELRVYEQDYATIKDLQAQPDGTALNIGFGAWGTAWYPGLPSRYVAFTSQVNNSNGDGVYLYEVNQFDPDNQWPLVDKGPAFVPMPNNQQNYRCAFSPDGKWFAYGSEASPYLFVYDVTDINNWTPVVLPATPNAFITDVAFDKNSEWLLACKPSASVPHAYAYEINNGWTLNTNNDLNQAALAWYCGHIPEQT